MIGIKFSLISLFLLTGTTISYCQDTKSLEHIAYQFFCSELNSKPIFKDRKIRFSGKTNSLSSRVYSIADGIGDISIIKDSIPNQNYLDSLDIYYKSIQHDIILLDNSFLQKGSKRSSKYIMRVYHAISYQRINYVEITFHSKKEQEVITLILRFNNDSSKIDKYYIKQLNYD